MKVKNLMTFTSEHAISSEAEPFSSYDFRLCTADGRTWPDVKHFLGEALDECHTVGRGEEEMSPMIPKVSSPQNKPEEVYRQ